MLRVEAVAIAVLTPDAPPCPRVTFDDSRYQLNNTMNINMAVPAEGQKVKPFNPPAWLVEKAKENAARLSLAPDALAKRLQEIKDKPKESKRMRLD